MELKDYLKIISRSWLTIGLVAVIFGIIGFVWAKRQVPTNQAITTFLVTQKPQTTSSSTFGYDNFYALSASAVVADQISALASSPNLVIEVYRKLNLTVPTVDPRRLTKVFRVQKNQSNSNSTSIAIEHQSPDTAKQLIDELKGQILSRIKSQQDQSQLSANFDVSASDTAVLTAKTDPKLRSAILAVVGLIVGSGFVLLKNYLTG